MERILVLVRHGESEWNKLNLFTGWTDVDLSATGVEEAKAGGVALKEWHRIRCLLYLLSQTCNSHLELCFS